MSQNVNICPENTFESKYWCHKRNAAAHMTDNSPSPTKYIFALGSFFFKRFLNVVQEAHTFLLVKRKCLVQDFSGNPVHDRFI